MAVPDHPMSRLKGTPEAKQMMAHVRGHKTKVGSKPGEAANTAGSDYADPGYQPDGLKRYPLDTPEHIRAAASYFGQARNRNRYTPAQQKQIDARIARAMDSLSQAGNEMDVAHRLVRRKGK